MQGLWIIKGLNVSKGKIQTKGVCEQGPDDIIWTKEMQEQEATKELHKEMFYKRYSCATSGVRCGVNEILTLLGCYAA
jgi:hypothetical protein